MLARERRVALVPDAVSRLVGGGHEVSVEAGAGRGAAIPDGDYVGSTRAAPSANRAPASIL